MFNYYMVISYQECSVQIGQLMQIISFFFTLSVFSHVSIMEELTLREHLVGLSLPLPMTLMLRLMNLVCLRTSGIGYQMF